MSTADLDALFARTLEGDYEGDEPWKAVDELRRIGTREIFDKAAKWCASDLALKRARAADILGQLGKTAENPRTLYADESFRLLWETLDEDTDPRSISSAIAALGHLGNPSAVPLICRFSSHPEREVRFDLAFALGCFPDLELSATTLLKLMTDADSEVRDWATFGLGVLGDLDSPEIREALFQNLADADQDVREEAMVGLCKRRDARALDPLLGALADSDPSDRITEAADLLLERPSDARAPDDYIAALKKKFRS